MVIQPSDEELAPSLPINPGYGIGIIGCGEIVNIAHLVAYKAANLNVVACYDINQSAAKATAEKFDIPHVCSSLDELLSDERVQIVDIAIHVEGRLGTIKKAAQANKHMLVQKPLAHNYNEAKEMVECAEENNVKMQVNQQARWAGTHVLMKKWLEMGAIGNPNTIHLHVRGWQDDPKTWYVRQENFTILDHGIHYFDLLRFFARSEHTSVQAIQKSIPGQAAIAPTVYACFVEFENDMTAFHSFHNKVETENPWELSLIIDGNEGMLSCDFKKVKLERKDGVTMSHEPLSKWFPDAFLGPMSDLMDAIEENREPACSGRENLKTLKLVLDAAESAGRKVYV